MKPALESVLNAVSGRTTDRASERVLGDCGHLSTWLNIKRKMNDMFLGHLLYDRL